MGLIQREISYEEFIKEIEEMNGNTYLLAFNPKYRREIPHGIGGPVLECWNETSGDIATLGKVEYPVGCGLLNVKGVRFIYPHPNRLDPKDVLAISRDTVETGRFEIGTDMIGHKYFTEEEYNEMLKYLDIDPDTIVSHVVDDTGVKKVTVHVTKSSISPQ